MKPSSIAIRRLLILASGNGAQVKLVGETIVGGTLKTSAGGTSAAQFGAVSGVTIAASSLIEVNNVIFSGGTIGAGAVVESSGGNVVVSGTVSNGGTLFANSAGDQVSITLGAVVNGGVALINNGIVKIAGSSGESVKFSPSEKAGSQLRIRRTKPVPSAAGCPDLAVGTTQTTCSSSTCRP